MIDIQVLTEVLEKFPAVKRKAIDTNKETSSDFNVFNLFKIDEPRHSILLGHLLDPLGEHGQGNSFIVKFLKKLGVHNPQEGDWSVHIEKGNIDILLRRSNPFSVVIIENKSNGAIDQPNQIYRYWHQEMYQQTKTTDTEYWDNHSHIFKILYLPLNKSKIPSKNSITKYPTFSDNNLPDKLPLKVDVWSFSSEIVEWLEECHNFLHKENYRLKEYINQYKEYWK